MDDPIIRDAIDDEYLSKILTSIAKLILIQDSQILELMTSVTVLKLAVAELRGEAPESALARFREREQKALESLPVSQKLQEVRELADLLEIPGKTFGLYKA